MGNLIDSQAAIDMCMRVEAKTGYDAACLIAQLPSERPEIIRCKDCYHYPNKYADCPMIGWARNENDFCSKAERRTDE